MIKELVDAKFWTEGRIELPLIQNTIKAMVEIGMLDKPVDAKTIIDTAFLPPELQK